MGRDSLLGFYSIPGIDFSPIARPKIPEPVFVNLLRSPEIDSKPCGTDSSESMPVLEFLNNLWAL
jgi:hypothetical protein